MQKFSKVKLGFKFSALISLEIKKDVILPRHQLDPANNKINFDHRIEKNVNSRNSWWMVTIHNFKQSFITNCTITQMSDGFTFILIFIVYVSFQFLPSKNSLTIENKNLWAKWLTEVSCYPSLAYDSIPSPRLRKSVYSCTNSMMVQEKKTAGWMVWYIESV